MCVNNAFASNSERCLHCSSDCLFDDQMNTLLLWSKSIIKYLLIKITLIEITTQIQMNQSQRNLLSSEDEEEKQKVDDSTTVRLDRWLSN